MTAVLLAAGQSKRMGRSKQLLPLADKPVIRWCLDGLLAGGVEDIVVVLGPNGREVGEAIEGYALATVWNNDPASDMAGSVRAGLNALTQRATAVMVLPVDHPLVLPQTIRTLTECHRQEPERIVIPVHKGRKGHPAVFPRLVIEELHALATLRDVVRRDGARVRLVEVDDEGILLNLNTPVELAEVKTRLADGE